MKRTWARFEAVMKQGSEGEMAALPPGNPEGEKRGPGAVKRSTKPCSGESQSEKHDEARDSPRMRGKRRKCYAKKKSKKKDGTNARLRSAEVRYRFFSVRFL